MVCLPCTVHTHTILHIIECPNLWTQSLWTYWSVAATNSFPISIVRDRVILLEYSAIHIASSTLSFHHSIYGANISLPFLWFCLFHKWSTFHRFHIQSICKMGFCLHCWYIFLILCMKPYKMEHLLHAIVTFSRIQEILQRIWFTSDICTGQKSIYCCWKSCATFVVCRWMLNITWKWSSIVSNVHTWTFFQSHFCAFIALFYEPFSAFDQ